MQMVESCGRGNRNQDAGEGSLGGAACRNENRAPPPPPPPGSIHCKGVSRAVFGELAKHGANAVEYGGCPMQYR
jgi:hypothetical protein